MSTVCNAAEEMDNRQPRFSANVRHPAETTHAQDINNTVHSQGDL